MPKAVSCIFIQQPKPMGLGHAIMCAERLIEREPFAVLLADDFLVPKGKGITSELVRKFEETRMSQLAVSEIEGPDISNYGVIVRGH